MAIFEIEGPDGVYEVDAPDEASAIAGFRKIMGKKPEGKHLTFEEGQKLLEQEEQSGISGAIGSALTGTLDGALVVGPTLLSGTQKAAAGISSLINGGSYEDNLAKAKSVTEAAQAEHPILKTAGNITGAVGSTIPMIMAAPAAFGGGAASMGVRSALSAASGAALGGADSAARSGGDPDAIWDGVKWGGGLGAFGPAVGAIVGKGAKSLIEAGRNRLAAYRAGTDPQALKFLKRAVADDGLDAATVQQKLTDMGPEAMLADLGPNLRQQAGGIASIPGKAQKIVRDGLTARQTGANARINTAVDENLGRNVVPSRIDAAAQANQAALGPEYTEVFRNARAVDTRPIADILESQSVNLRGDAQKVVQRVRQMLDITGTDQLDPNPGTLFQTRHAIDGLMDTTADTNAMRALTAARRSIDETLENSVPGLKDVDAKFAELARQREALQRGQQVLESGRTAPRPSELAAEVQEGALPQGRQIGPSAVPLRLSQGARAEVDRIVGTNANDVVALNRIIKGEGDWNRSRLATLFGQEKADRLFKVLETERLYADTANTVTRNSETAARQAAQAELGGGAQPMGIQDSFKAGGFSGAARSVVLDKAKTVAQALLPEAGTVARENLAKALVGQNRDAIIRALTASGGTASTPALVDPVVKALMLGGAAAAAR